MLFNILATLFILLSIYIGIKSYSFACTERRKRKEEISLKREKDRIECLKARDYFKGEIRIITNNHIFTLLKKYSQCSLADDYGKISFNEVAWARELDYFVTSILFQEIKERTKDNYFSKFLFELTAISNELVSSIVVETYKKNTASYGDMRDLNPFDFEFACSDMLRKGGWTVQVTKKSGDKGVDIIGWKDNKKAVFQCKKVSSPVGLKAVQEIFTGRKHLAADYGFVVSNNSYTKSAIDLASSTNIGLIHYSELEKLNI